MLTNLLNRFRKIKPKKDVHKYKKTYNLKLTPKLRMFEHFISEYSKVNFNIRPSPTLHFVVYTNFISTFLVVPYFFILIFFNVSGHQFSSSWYKSCAVFAYQ